jgi:hypothetical protein
MAVPEELMEILRCIECYSMLEERGPVLVCTGCGLRFPVEDGIPIMLADSATREGTP